MQTKSKKKQFDSCWLCVKLSTINRTPNLHVLHGISDSVPSNNIMKIIISRLYEMVFYKKQDN